jgi:hypothetical protein
MVDLFSGAVKPIDVLSDGRRYRRFVKDAGVSVTFGGQAATGNLVNISVSGMLTNFPSSGTLPRMSEKVEVHLEVGGKDNILEMRGTVVRIQVPKQYEKQDMIEIAIDFSDLTPASRHGIQKLIKFLVIQAKGYTPQ